MNTFSLFYSKRPDGGYVARWWTRYVSVLMSLCSDLVALVTLLWCQPVWDLWWMDLTLTKVEKKRAEDRGREPSPKGPAQ